MRAQEEEEKKKIGKRNAIVISIQAYLNCAFPFIHHENDENEVDEDEEKMPNCKRNGCDVCLANYCSMAWMILGMR